MNNIAQEMKEYRRDKSLTQKDLAQKLGVSTVQIARIETGASGASEALKFRFLTLVKTGSCVMPSTVQNAAQPSVPPLEPEPKNAENASPHGGLETAFLRVLREVSESTRQAIFAAVDAIRDEEKRG